jgi:phage-related protein
MITKDTNKLDVAFYKTDTGNEPVREWLKELVKDDKKVIGADIKTVQFSWPLGMPLVRSLGKGLWEVRSNLNSNRIARVIFFTHNNTIVLLHGFMRILAKWCGQSC